MYEEDQIFNKVRAILIFSSVAEYKSFMALKKLIKIKKLSLLEQSELLNN